MTSGKSFTNWSNTSMDENAPAEDYAMTRNYRKFEPEFKLQVCQMIVDPFHWRTVLNPTCEVAMWTGWGWRAEGR